MRIHLTDRVIDLERRDVRSRDAVVQLTELETSLIRYLAAHPGPVSRDTLLVDVWNYPKPVATRCVDTAMRRLRAKLEADPKQPQHVLKVHGVGYRFVVDAAPPAILPLPSSQTDLPVCPELVGRSALVRFIADALLHHPIVTLLGPPGVGRRALAIAVGHAVGARYPAGVWQRDSDPGTGALWLRLTGRVQVTSTPQLVIADAPTGLDDERTVVVPPLTDADSALLLADLEPADRARFLQQAGGLPACLKRRVPPPPINGPPVIRALAAFAGGWSMHDVQLLGLELSRDDLRGYLETGWLMHVDRGYRVPASRPVQPGREDLERHLDGFERWLHDQWGAGPVQAGAFSALRARWPDAQRALTTACDMPGDRAIQLVVRLSLFLRAIIDIEENVAWTERALLRAETQQWRSKGLGRLAEFLRLAGRLQEAHAALEKADGLAVATERGSLQALRATLLHTEGRHAESLVYYLSAAEALDDTAPDRACVLRSEAALQTLRQGDADAAVQLGRQAMATARRTGDAKLLSRCEGRLGLVLARLGWHWEALPRLEASADIPRETGDDQALAFSLFHLAEARTDAGELSAALTALHEGSAVADRLHIPVLQAMYRSGLGVVHLLSDRPKEARSPLEDAIRLHHDAEQPARTHYALGWLAVCHAELGNPHLALPTLEQCQRVATEAGRSQAATALWTALTHLVLDGDTAQAQAALDRAVTNPDRAIDLDLRILETHLRQRLSRCCNSVTT